MQIIERAEIVGRSFGDNNLVMVNNQFSEGKSTVINSKNLSLEIGEVYFLTIDSSVNQIVSAEVVSSDEIVLEAAMAN